MKAEKKDKGSEPKSTEKMLVIVDKDWSRTYAATVNTFISKEEGNTYSAKCEIKNASIISAAESKYRLSENMDELATIIEDRLSREIPSGTTRVAGLNYYLS